MEGIQPSPPAFVAAGPSGAQKSAPSAGAWRGQSSIDAGARNVAPRRAEQNPEQRPTEGASANNTPYQAHGAVAVITLDNPPMNGLSHALRRKIVAGVEQAESDAAIKAIVLIGSAKVFSSGADIREFGTPMTF